MMKTRFVLAYIEVHLPLFFYNTPIGKLYLLTMKN